MAIPVLVDAVVAALTAAPSVAGVDTAELGPDLAPPIVLSAESPAGASFNPVAIPVTFVPAKLSLATGDIASAGAVSTPKLAVSAASVIVAGAATTEALAISTSQTKACSLPLLLLGSSFSVAFGVVLFGVDPMTVTAASSDLNWVMILRATWKLEEGACEIAGGRYTNGTQTKR